MIIPNIIAYILLSFGSFKAFEWSHKNGTKFTFIINFILMFWSMFMFTYLIAEYENIIKSPINEKLNLFETTTNAIIALYILSFNFKKRKNE